MLSIRKKTVLSTLLIALFLAVEGFPFYIMFVGAFKPNMALRLLPPDINLFGKLVTANFTYVVQKSEIWLWLFNSFLIGIFVALITVLIAATAGYAFAKLRFPFSGALFAVIIATMILPKQILLIPNYLVALNLRLTDSLWGVIITTVTPPFGVFLCRQFMQTIPMELSESAEMDGCSEPGKFLRIVLPLSLPAVGALGVFAFFAAYNDYLWQLVMISSKKLHTIPIGIAMFAQKATANTGYQLMAAALATVPVLILFISCQRFFVKGITLGGVKG